MGLRKGTSCFYGEKVALFVLSYKDSQNWAVIHDLRIEHRGRVAQIDHLLINPKKHFQATPLRSNE